MMSPFDNPVLECQDCGTTIFELTPGQAHRVALDPYNYVSFCLQCRTERMRGDGAGD